MRRPTLVPHNTHWTRDVGIGDDYVMGMMDAMTEHIFLDALYDPEPLALDWMRAINARLDPYHVLTTLDGTLWRQRGARPDDEAIAAEALSVDPEDIINMYDITVPFPVPTSIDPHWYLSEYTPIGLEYMT